MAGTDDPPGSVTQAFHRLRVGDSAAADRLWEYFFPRLVGLARRTLAGRPQCRADAEDVALSAFASFWRRAGDFRTVVDRNDLWNLLAKIAVRKAFRQAAAAAADKRGGGRVLDEAALAGLGGGCGRLDEIAGAASPRGFDLHCEELLLALPEELRRYAVLRLMGYANKEIAEAEGCTVRKIERKFGLIRLHWAADAE